MQELLIHIEQACQNLDWPKVFVPGAIATIIGLFLWLGGQKYSAFIIGCLGGLFGALVGYMAGQPIEVNIYIPVIAGAVIFAIISVIFQQAVIFTLAALICASAFGFVYLTYVMQDNKAADSQTQTQQGAFGKPTTSPEKPATPPIEQPPAIEPPQLPPNFDPCQLKNLPFNPEWISPQTHQQAVKALEDIMQRLKNTAKTKQTNMILITVLGAAIGLAIAILLKSVIMALCCSIVGTTATVLGVIAILLAKGASPITALLARPKILLAIVVAMVLIGFIAQMLLARTKKTSKSASEQEDKE